MSTFNRLIGAMLIAATAALGCVLPASLAVAQQGQVIQGPLTIIGHQRSAGLAPALSTCGTSPAVGQGANDQSGRIVTGSGATTCTITFAATYTSAPVCVVSAEVATQPTYTVSATAITFATSIASTAYHYRCVGVGSGS